MNRLCILLSAALVGCPSADVVTDDDDATDATDDPKFGSSVIGGDRPANVVVPAAYDGFEAAPLIVLLHGYGASAQLQDFYFRYSARSDADGFLLVLPDGTDDSSGTPFWNASPTSDEPIDDVAYLTGLVDEMEETWQVDPDRIYFAGHSNGGFMSYRMACEIPERLAGILNFAGLSPYLDEAGCTPTEPVSVLHVHGTQDDQVPYAPSGGRLGAEAVASLWADRAGCDLGAPAEGVALDLIDGIDGDETTITNYEAGCEDNRSVSLWTLQEGGHLPLFNDGWAEQTIGWLLERRR